MREVSLYQNAWGNESDQVLLSFPDTWKVEYHDTPADRMHALAKEELKSRLDHPLGMPSIRELAAHGREVCIAFDDLSRGTPIRGIAELVLDELLTAGIEKEHIRFLCALGTHGAMSRDQMVLKLGEDIVANYPVLNHNVVDGFATVGKDADGNDIRINREFMHCDVRIGIGSVCPHPQAGFGGGGKLIIPGLASMDTIYHHHIQGGFAPSGELGGNRFRNDIDALSAFCEPFFKIDAILNSRRQIVELSAGNMIASRNAAMRISAEVNALSVPSGPADIVIANANVKLNEPFIAVSTANRFLKQGGDVVLVNFCRSGLVPHYLCGYWGETNVGMMPVWKERPPAKWSRLIYFSPYPEATAKPQFQNPEHVYFARTWEEAAAMLNDGGEKTVSVLSEATNTYLPDEKYRESAE